jgi:cytochrome c oxidase assembly protein subunit 15
VTVSIVVFTSHSWMRGPQFDVTSGGNIRRLALATAVLAYLQIVVGAVMRHVPVDAQPGTFTLAIRSHLFLAAILTIHALLLGGLVLSRIRHVRPINYLAAALVVLILCQVLLGIATWMEKFALPTWAVGWMPPHSAPVREGGWLQTHIITAHVATGSLILGTSVAVALYAQRLLPSTPRNAPALHRKLGAAV